MDVPILFEDEYFLVVDKPFGIVVNRSVHSPNNTLADWSENYLQLNTLEEDNASSFIQRAGIVHRLDKETSGVILIAKDAHTFAKLQREFLNRKVIKHYLALVHGNVTSDEGEINAPVGRLPWNRMRFGVLPQGRDAVTMYKVLARYQQRSMLLSYLSVTPRTGRTHQIRIHLAYCGHTIVSDPLYAGRKVLRQDLLLCPRMFLHATSLQFSHPVTGNPITIQSPLQKDLQNVLTHLSRKTYNQVKN